MKPKSHSHSHRTRGRDRHKDRLKHKKSCWFSELVAWRAPRIGRGETRYFILDTLKEGGRHGYDIIKNIHEKTDSMYRPSPGTVYT